MHAKIHRRKKSSGEKIRKRPRKSPIWKFFSRHKKLLFALWIVTGIALLGIIGTIILRHTLLAEEYTMQQIRFAESSVAVYDHPAIYKEITTELQGRNYFLTKWFNMGEVHEQVVSTHPIVESIEVTQNGEQQVFTEVSFHSPSLVFVTPTDQFALYEYHFFDLTTGNSLGDDSPYLLLPDYTSGYDSLDGILYEIDEAQLVEQLDTIESTLGGDNIGKISYLPGGVKLIVEYKGKNVFFHLDKNVNEQLAQLVDMENHFEGFNDLTKIDVGSIDDMIVK